MMSLCPIHLTQDHNWIITSCVLKERRKNCFTKKECSWEHFGETTKR